MVQGCAMNRVWMPFGNTGCCRTSEYDKGREWSLDLVNRKWELLEDCFHWIVEERIKNVCILHQVETKQVQKQIELSENFHNKRE